MKYKFKIKAWWLYLVISMHHDHDSNGACGESIAYLPHQLPGFVFRLVLNLEHAAEVLSETM